MIMSNTIPRSLVWDFFIASKAPSNKVKCILCSKNIFVSLTKNKLRYNGTSNMLRHLRAKHEDKFYAEEVKQARMAGFLLYYPKRNSEINSTEIAADDENYQNNSTEELSTKSLKHLTENTSNSHISSDVLTERVSGGQKSTKELSESGSNDQLPAEYLTDYLSEVEDSHKDLTENSSDDENSQRNMTENSSDDNSRGNMTENSSNDKNSQRNMTENSSDDENSKRNMTENSSNDENSQRNMSENSSGDENSQKNMTKNPSYGDNSRKKLTKRTTQCNEILTEQQHSTVNDVEIMPKRRRLRVRKRRHKPNQKYKHNCQECDYKSNHTGTFNRHMFIHAQGSWACNLCDFETRYWDSLRTHKLIHRISGKYTCKCGFKSDFAYHMSKHKCRLIQCDLCEFKALTHEEIVNHKLENHPNTNVGNQELKFACSQCEFKTYAKGRLVLHSLIHENAKLKCPKCEFSTTAEPLMAVHTHTHDLPLNERAKDCPELQPNSTSGRLNGHQLPDTAAPLMTVHMQTHDLPINKRANDSPELQPSKRSSPNSTSGRLNSHQRQDTASSPKPPTMEVQQQENQQVNYVTKQNVIKCHLCSFTSPSEKLLKEHIITHIVDYDTVEEHHTQLDNRLNSQSSESDENSRRSESHTKKLPNFSWPYEDKLEIYWCHLFARHRAFRKHGKYKRFRKILRHRGILEAWKVDASDIRFQGLIALIKSGKTQISFNDRVKIQKSVNEFAEKNKTGLINQYLNY